MRRRPAATWRCGMAWLEPAQASSLDDAQQSPTCDHPSASMAAAQLPPPRPLRRRRLHPRDQDHDPDRRHGHRHTAGYYAVVAAAAVMAIAGLQGAAAQETAAATPACSLPSTLMRSTGARAHNEAMLYDASCRVLTFRVDHVAGIDLSLNVSNLNIVTVKSYPRVYRLLLGNNQLQKFAPDSEDGDMEWLDLSGNQIADAQQLQFPRRLSYLDLSNNKITKLDASTSWPASLQLQTLILNDNSLESVDPSAFQVLRALQSLYLSKTTLTSIAGWRFPAALANLNVASNMLTSNTTNFSNLPSSLVGLDASNNQLTVFPPFLARKTSLVSVNLNSNNITSIRGVRFPASLKSLSLENNPLESIEICASDVPVLQGLDTFKVSSSLGSTCSNSAARSQKIRDISICVLDDKVCAKTLIPLDPVEDLFAPGTVRPSSGSAAGSSATTPAEPTGTDAPVKKEANSGSLLAISSGASFLVGLLVAILAFVMYRRRRTEEKVAKSIYHLSYSLERGDREGSERGDIDDDEETDDSWIFDTPQNGVREVALLEEDEAHRKKHSRLEDLLVFEIPLEEVELVQRLGAAGPLDGSDELFLAEYQGFQVVVSTLLRQKKERGRKRKERELVEHVRLASSMEHSNIVQFIGLTMGGNSQQQATRDWKLGVILEYMSSGTLASLFYEERQRREGKLFTQLSSTSSCSGDIFSWFPVMTSTDGMWRCKLSMALDVSMALVYLHGNGVLHGHLASDTVYVNEQGEAKLSIMNVDLHAADSSPKNERLGLRQSAALKLKKMMRITQHSSTSFTHSPLSSSSLMHGGGATFLTTQTSIANEDFTTSHHMHSGVARPSRGVHSGHGGHSSTRFKVDIYAFGLLLWEMDTMLSVEATKDMALDPVLPGEVHQILKFSPECPSDIAQLARRCWHPNPHERPDAIDLQEELTRLMEGRLTMNTPSMAVGGALHAKYAYAASASGSSVLSVSPSRSTTNALIIEETGI